jgi:hypothetical protein
MKAVFIHFFVSILIALIAFLVIFKLWYTFPYNEVSGGAELFFILVAVDVSIGPLLTAVVFSKKKPLYVFFKDVTMIATVQLAALCYGIWTLYEARPVLIAFEGDRFRIVSNADIVVSTDEDRLLKSRNLSLCGPKPIGVKLLDGNDPDFPLSIQMAMAGLHPAFQPKRWTPYASELVNVINALKDMNTLMQKNIAKIDYINSWLIENDLSKDSVGYIPLVSNKVTDWVVVVDKKAGLIKGYLHVDGW